MNSQIEKLALECGAWHQVYKSKRFMHDHNFDIEKFAELIVRDIHQYVDSLDTAQIISNGILRRYGVEE
jgi:hypothetical protein